MWGGLAGVPDSLSGRFAFAVGWRGDRCCHVVLSPARALANVPALFPAWLYSGRCATFSLVTEAPSEPRNPRSCRLDRSAREYERYEAITELYRHPQEASFVEAASQHQVDYVIAVRGVVLPELERVYQNDYYAIYDMDWTPS